MQMPPNQNSPARSLFPWRSSLLPLALVAGLNGVSAYAQDAEVVTKIEVLGTQKLTPETVLFKAGLKEGEDLRSIDFTALTEKLWATGSFDDIKFEVSDLKDGKKLTIRVVERPLLKEVDFRGGTEVGISGIKDKIKEHKLAIGQDTLYDPEVVRKVKGVIAEQCAEKGFRNPVIDVILEPMGPGVARLVFDIKEGGKVRIYRIAFRGNKVLSSSKLKAAMKKTRTHWMLSWLTSHDLLVDKNLEEDLQNVKTAYWRVGYKDVFVGQPTIEVDDHTSSRRKAKNAERAKAGKSPTYDLRASLVIPILEGDRYYEGKLQIHGNDKVFKGEKGEQFYRTKLAEAKRDNRSGWAKFFNLKPSTEDRPSGKVRPFDLDALNKGVDKIREAYSNQAYIMFRADKKLEVREENGLKKVDVTLNVDEGEPYTIRRIQFEGNTTTKDKVLRRAMLLKEGDLFRTDLFRESFTGIGQLGFFDVKKQEPKVDLVPEKPQVDITVRGEEAGVNELLFQGGYGSVLGFTLGASFSTKNLAGSGETISVSYNGGTYQRMLTLGFQEPYVFDKPYSFSASVSDGTTDYDASRVGAAYAYKQTTRSVGVSVGTRLSTLFPGRTWAFFTTYALGYTFRVNQYESSNNYLYRDASTLLSSSVSQSLTYSTVNHPFRPSTGTRLSFVFEYGGWQFGSDRPFYRTSWNVAKFASLGERHVFAANLSYGYLRNLSSGDIPIYDLFRPGGESSVRGYRYGQVGSVILDNTGSPLVVGGNKQFVSNWEYQFKLAEPFQTVLFFDAGNAWGPGSQIFNRDMVSYVDKTGRLTQYENPALLKSIGVEFRFFLPISPAPLRFIWAKKLNPYPFDTYGATDFQFSIGTTF